MGFFFFFFLIKVHGLIWEKSIIRQYSLNTVVDVSRRELEALRQRPDELVTSFISRWREKIAQIINIIA